MIGVFLTQNQSLQVVSMARNDGLKHGLICNSKQHYAMFKIPKCENCVVCLRFAELATSRLKPDKVLKVIFTLVKVVPVLLFLC